MLRRTLTPAPCHLLIGHIYIITGPKFDDARDIEAVRDRLSKEGIVFVNNCGEQELVELTQSLGVPIRPRNEEKKGSCVSHIRNTPGLVGKGYTSEGKPAKTQKTCITRRTYHHYDTERKIDKLINTLLRETYSLVLTTLGTHTELFFHTDRSGWAKPPAILATALKTPATGGGGASLFVDGREVAQYIRVHEPALYDMMVSTSPSHTSFKSDDGSFAARPIIVRLQQDQDEDQSHESSESDEEGGMRDMIIRFRLDGGIRFSPAMLSMLPRLEDLICERAFGVELSAGQGYIVDNHRFLHGRTAFEGDREILRVLAHSHDQA